MFTFSVVYLRVVRLGIANGLAAAVLNDAALMSDRYDIYNNGFVRSVIYFLPDLSHAYYMPATQVNLSAAFSSHTQGTS